MGQSANRSASVARGAHLRLLGEEFGIETEARRTWRAIASDGVVKAKMLATPLRHTVNRLLREEDRADPLAKTALLLCAWARAGASEAQCRLVPTFLSDVVDSAFTGGAHRSADVLDREELALEAEEDRLTLELRLGVVTPALLREAAEANRAEAAVQLERARFYDRLARQMEAGLLVRAPFGQTAA